MQAARDLSHELQQLAAQLYNEPCCRSLSLHSKPLSEVLQSLSGSHPGVDGTMQESLRRFRAVFHLFLMQLDRSGISGVDLLSTLRLTEYLPVTAVETAPLVLAPVAPSEPAAPSPGSTKAREFFELALHFEKQTDPEISPEQACRLEALHLCFAVEIESQESLEEPLKAFWPHRQSALKGLLAGPQHEIAEPLFAEWQRLVAEKPYWPKSQKLPIAAFRNSLRYLGASTEARPVATPTLLEAGLWTYLFGQDLELSGIWLVNHLNLTCEEPHRIADAFLRLSRCFQIKSVLTHPGAPFSESLRNEVRGHARMLLGFWSR